MKKAFLFKVIDFLCRPGKPLASPRPEKRSFALPPCHQALLHAARPTGTERDFFHYCKRDFLIEKSNFFHREPTCSLRASTSLVACSLEKKPISPQPPPHTPQVGCVLSPTSPNPYIPRPYPPHCTQTPATRTTPHQPSPAQPSQAQPSVPAINRTPPKISENCSCKSSTQP